MSHSVFCIFDARIFLGHNWTWVNVLWGFRSYWVIWMDRLHSYESLKIFTWIGNEFSLSSSRYHFSLLLIIIFSAGTRSVKISKWLQKNKRNAPWKLWRCEARVFWSYLHQNCLHHWPSGSFLKDSNRRYFDSPSSFRAALTVIDAADRGTTRQCSFAQLNILTKESSQQPSID